MHEELSNPDDQDINDAALSRCDTILNITSAEIERVDKERLADLRAISEKYLDGQIACHEQVRTTNAFALFDTLYKRLKTDACSFVPASCIVGSQPASIRSFSFRFT